ncbi:serine hydrolase domain-containing protein [Dictyobacter aurantiacus]|uniref:Serine hydrolase n=1 Tax=Dictyobacter aurantiacus TaxID=1936993 RepID=A0A401ZKS7_9CHLR|nr:serine hydrolase domain-containing protein [Dictyobacter aurantiacus]GCE07453.1 serine hydrolase [Dictyobacter aurantiacus]
MISTKIDALLHAQIGSQEPGVAIALLKEDHIVHCQGYGMANLEWGQPVTPRTVFGLGSLTKPFTATAIMLLEKQGKLRLDDPIQHYLPAYPISQHTVTLRHLLTHTSGIPNFVTQPKFWDKHAHAVNSADEVIALFKELPSDFLPGTKYSYSNSGYVLLGRILERLLDMSYAEVMQRLIFAPLGMTHSYYLSPEPIIPSRASGYTHTEQGYHHARFITAAAKYAAGGLGSTLEDLLLWDTALREERLLDRMTQDRMYAPVQLATGDTENYGLGWGIGQYRRHPFMCHAGGVPGFSSFFGRFPEDGVTIVILSNRDGFDASGLARQLSHLVLDLPAPRRTPVSCSPETKRNVIGSYSGVFGTVEVKEEEQTLYLDGWSKYALVPLSETSFYRADDRDTEVHFEKPDEQGNATRLRVIQPFFWFTAERSAD